MRGKGVLNFTLYQKTTQRVLEKKSGRSEVFYKLKSFGFINFTCFYAPPRACGGAKYQSGRSGRKTSLFLLTTINKVKYNTDIGYRKRGV